jgi:DNA invertase Pin-like site-specific DNA recombinase
MSRFNEIEVSDIINNYVNNYMTMKEISLLYKCCRKAISKVLKENNIEIFSKFIKLKEEETNKLIEQYQNPTITTNTILKNFKLNKIVFYRILKENNIPIINKRYYNFTDDEINHIISLYNNGENTVTIGKLYNVLPDVINRLLVKNNTTIKDDRYINFTDNIIKDIISLYNTNNSTRYIAELYNVSPDTIIKILRKNDIILKDPRIIDFSKDDIDTIINLYNENNSAKKIGKLYNTSVQPIYKILRDNNIEIINNKHINFTDEQIKDICNLYCDKQLSITNICKKYNCSIPTITSTLRNCNIEILRNNSSSPENLIKYILQYFDNTISEKSDKQILNGKEIDIINYDKKIGFEYNGLYFHSTNKKGENYHINKTNLANENNFELYHIFEDEFLSNSTLVINLLLEKLNINHYITDECFEYLEDCFINEVSVFDINLEKYININSNDCFISEIQSDIKQNQFYIGYGVVKYFDETNNINYGVFTKENNIQIGYYSINGDNIIENFYIEEKYNFKNFDINIFNDYIEKHKPTNLIIKFDKRWFSKKHLKDFENIGFILDSEEEPRISYYKNDKRFHGYDDSYSENIIHDCGSFVYKLEI